MKKDSEYTYNFKLSPTSPIIMFQKNGMLRATEVKPKLDKYLNKNAKILESWKLKNGVESLNYKMSIKQYKETEMLDWSNRSNEQRYYFNLFYGDRKNNFLYFLYPEIQIVCLIPELLIEIKKHIKDFVIVTNFGTFQNKGFGGFQLAGQSTETEEIISSLKKHYGCKVIGEASFKNKDVSFNNIKNHFDFIKSFYTIMKSGMNFNGYYKRSYLFDYMHKKGIDNEKAYLKEKGIAPNLITNKGIVLKKQINKKPHYVRSLLGVGNFIDFRADKNNPTIKQRIIISNNNIQRYPSPVIFKLINGNVYILMNNNQDNLFGIEFEFKNNTTNKNETISTISKSDNFDKDDFLKSYINEWNRINDYRVKGSKTKVEVL